MSGIFSAGEVEYMATQRLGRLATQQRSGLLQVSPVSFYFNAAHESIDIGGRDMANSQKFRNVSVNGRAAFVVDDIASLDPWRVRCLDIRGHAEAILEPEDSVARSPGAIIRVFPARIISWGIDPPEVALGKRDVVPSPGPDPSSGQ